MNPWEGIAGQMLGSAAGTQDFSAAMGCGMAYPYSHGNYIPMDATTTTSNTLYIGDADMDIVVEEKVEEPPDEFTQLSNHKFHELLDRFYELI